MAQRENNVFTHADSIDQVDTYSSVQSFTPQVNYDLVLVKLKMARKGSPGITTVEIHTADGSDIPTGASLATETFNGNDLTTNLNNPEIKTITYISPASLGSGTKYAIQVIPTNFEGNVTYVAWYDDNLATAYANGRGMERPNGTTWVARNSDFYFDTYDLRSVIPKVCIF